MRHYALLEQHLEDASVCALDGRLRACRTRLGRARACATEVYDRGSSERVSFVSRSIQINSAAEEERLLILVERLRKSALLGDVPRALRAKQQLEDMARISEQRVPFYELNLLENKAYENAFGNALRFAWISAEEGDVSRVKRLLLRAHNYGAHCGEFVDPVHESATLTLAYGVRAARSLDTALESAKNKCLHHARVLLTKARIDAKRARCVLPTAKVESVRSLIITGSIENMLNFAREAAEEGYKVLVDRYIVAAERYARKGKFSIDNDDIAAVYSILKKACGV